jgi:hypothetical protein
MRNYGASTQKNHASNGMIIVSAKHDFHRDGLMFAFYLGLPYNKTIIMKSSIWRGKLNSQFIVTARMDFQIFSKKFIFHIEYSNYMALLPRPLERCN